MALWSFNKCLLIPARHWMLKIQGDKDIEKPAVHIPDPTLSDLVATGHIEFKLIKI